MIDRTRNATRAGAMWLSSLLAVLVLTACSGDSAANGETDSTANGATGAAGAGQAGASGTAGAGTAGVGVVGAAGASGADGNAGASGDEAISDPDAGTNASADGAVELPDAAVDDEVDAAVPEPRPIAGGVIAGSITGGNPPLQGPVDLAAHGYVEEEFFLEGEATAYAADGELGLDGKWSALPDGQAAYRTRLLVRRPALASDWNGTVMVEWLNVTGGFDGAIGFTLAWEELLRGGYVYVGVSVQKAGVDSLKNADLARYGTLNHPGDQYAYDIYAQAGAAIGWPGSVDPLHGLPARRLIAYGESQSAMRMITYVNAVHPKTHVYDGYIIHSRAGWGAPVGTESDGFLGNGQPVQVRSDIDDARVLQFFTESELFLSLGPAYDARQPDSSWLRSWEVAGAAHADQHMVGEGANLGCGLLNDGPQHFVLKAAVRAMHRWLKDGTPPPHGAPIEVTAAKDAIARDALGLALGGIRTPTVDAPIAMNSGEPASQNAGNPLCMLFGQSIPFTAEQLLALYPTHQAYVDAVTVAAASARKAGFILPEEEATIVAEAIAAPVPQ